jgi:hypothetical protein
MFGNNVWRMREHGFLEVFPKKRVMSWLEKKQAPSWRKLRG